MSLLQPCAVLYSATEKGSLTEQQLYQFLFNQDSNLTIDDYFFNPPSECSIANVLSINAQNKYPFNEHFERKLTQWNYRLFSYLPPNDASSKINEYIQQKTKGMIPNICNSSDLIPPSPMCIHVNLFNAIAFQDQWEKKFDADYNEVLPFYYDNTQKKDFKNHRTEKSFVEIEYLVQKNKHQMTAENEQFIYLAIPFNNAAFELEFFKPQRYMTVDELLTELTHEKMNALRNQRVKRKLAIYIPKIEIENHIELEPIFKNNNLGHMLERGIVHFPNLIENPPKELIQSYIKKASQNVKLLLNEEGVKISSGTHFLIHSTLGGARSQKFEGNIPFIYTLSYIDQNQKRTTLFIGTFNTLKHSENVSKDTLSLYGFYGALLLVGLVFMIRRKRPIMTRIHSCINVIFYYLTLGLTCLYALDFFCQRFMISFSNIQLKFAFIYIIAVATFFAFLLQLRTESRPNSWIKKCFNYQAQCTIVLTVWIGILTLFSSLFSM